MRTGAGLYCDFGPTVACCCPPLKRLGEVNVTWFPTFFFEKFLGLLPRLVESLIVFYPFYEKTLR